MPDMDRDTFNALRNNRGLSVRALARVSGVSQGTVAALAAGTRVSVRDGTAEALATALGVPVDALIKAEP